MTKEFQVAQAFKSIARNEYIKSYVQQSTELYALLLQAAKRFVTGETRHEGIVTAKRTNYKRVSYFTGVYRGK